MGYAIFANRKIALTNQINMLQIELEDIMSQKQSLLNFSANVASGLPATDDVCCDIRNLGDYIAYKNDLDSYITNNYGMMNADGTFTTSMDQQIAQALIEWDEQNSDFNTYVLSQLPSDAGFVPAPNDSSKTIFDQQAYTAAVQAKAAEWSQITSDADPNAFAAYQRYAQNKAKYAQQLENKAYNNLSQEFYENSASKKIAALENSLELKQKRIETKLTALKTDLQSVEQAEGQAIQMATPKYSGVA